VGGDMSGSMLPDPPPPQVLRDFGIRAGDALPS
jgi:hypothetical protein